ncbi:MAG: autotransporter domain-containing protein [Phenylobacterium sp.]|uniref:autotransporter domain-containing protein n=2 Tax=Phenylobacterium sp. TaxID=1871053 RepID=UPI00391A5C73
MDRRWLGAAAATPLLWAAAGAAQAETTISTAVTTPVATATANSGAPDDLTIASGGSVKPTGGTAVTLNSDNDVSIAGTAAITDANGATALLIEGGRTGEVTLSGTLTVDESTAVSDTDGDGDNDGPFATGSNRHGVRVTGSEAFHGSIVQTAGSITVEGNDSAGVSAETAVDGSIRTAGSVSVTGTRAYGVHAASTVGGDVRTTGSVAVLGEGAVGVAVDENVGGKLVLGNAVTATGYRYTTRPSDTSKLDADDLLQGGPAVRIQGSVQGGVLVDAPPPNNDADEDDEDGDGVADSAETTGVVTSYGQAAAMQIGGADAIRLGAVGTGADAYGLVIKGTVQGGGIYDGVSGLGVEIGGRGGAVDVQGGVKVDGQVSATAREAGAVALHLKAGASAPSLANSGIIQTVVAADGAVAARAVQIDQGASALWLTNNGTISTTITGTEGSAVAVADAAGSLRQIENTNRISATFVLPDDAEDGAVIDGETIALDLRANTAGVTVRQTANADEDITPAIVGDVLLGSGDARLELLAGTLNGKVAFGAGADTLVIDGGATLRGDLTDAGGGLAMTIAEGRLTTTNTGALALTRLDLGSEGELVVTADPVAGTATRLNVAGAATLADGAKVGLRFETKLTEPASFTLIDAASLDVQGQLDDSLLTEGPWLYKTSLRADEAAGELIADVRRRTAAEAGLNAAEASAYDAVFEAFDRDEAVRDALLDKTDAEGFRSLYDQFLPDYAGGLFRIMASANEATGRAIDETEALLPRRGMRVWAQEIGVIHRQDLEGADGFEAGGFGFATGVEATDTPLGALGLQASFLNVTVDENGAAAAEKLTGSALSAGGYWRNQMGGLHASAGLTGGYAWLQGDRAVVDTDAGLTREASSEWNAVTAAAHLGLSYTAEAGRFYAKPLVQADYFYFKEDGRTESGGGEAIDLAIEARTSQQLAAFAGVAFGVRFGDPETMVWRPEVTVGYRALTGDGPDATTAQFVSGGPSFTLAAPELEDGAAVLRAGIRGQSRYFDLALEGGGEIRDDYEAYDARVTARLVF